MKWLSMTASDPEGVLKTLQEHYGGMEPAMHIPPDEMDALLPKEKNAAALIALARFVAKFVSLETFGKKPLLNSYEKAVEYVRARYIGSVYERCLLLCLDKNFRLLKCMDLYGNSIMELSLSLRCIVNEAVTSGATYTVLSHNHPSGTLDFSANDLQMTIKTAYLMQKVDVVLVDHILYGGAKTVSLRKEKLLREPVWNTPPEHEAAVKAWLHKKQTPKKKTQPKKQTVNGKKREERI